MEGSSDDVAPQLSHFTTVATIVSSVSKFLERKSLKLISSTCPATFKEAISLAAPQYSHDKCTVPGLNFNMAPHPWHANSPLTA
jgi:hypothetical protein